MVAPESSATSNQWVDYVTTAGVAHKSNPTVSVYGTTCTSGTSCTPTVPLTSVAAQAANTGVANVTGGSAVPTAVPLPAGGTNGCSGSTDAATYTAGTGWGCHQISGGSGTVVTLNQQDQLSPITITTASTHYTLFTYSMPGSTLTATKYLDILSGYTASGVNGCTAYFHFGGTLSSGGTFNNDGGALQVKIQPITATSEFLMMTQVTTGKYGVQPITAASETLSGTIAISLSAFCSSSGGTVTPGFWIVERHN